MTYYFWLGKEAEDELPWGEEGRQARFEKEPTQDWEVILPLNY